MSFWDAVWLIFISFAFIAYLMAMFSIILDLFRDKTVSGGMKAVWLACLMFLPLVTAIVYLIVRGGGMAARSVKDAETMRAAQEDYIRSVAGDTAGTSATDQIEQGKRLLDSGALTQDEFAALKAKALR
ncbi:MAG: SHOCT domain-containing protein [Ornithinibacter sp.]